MVDREAQLRDSRERIDNLRTPEKDCFTRQSETFQQIQKLARQSNTRPTPKGWKSYAPI